MPVTLNTSDDDFDARFAAMLSAKREDSGDVNAVVAGIIADVRARGDAVLCELTARFDRLELTPDRIRFAPDEIEAEVAKVGPRDRAALILAAERIRAYHARQMPEGASWTDPEGATLGWRWTPVSAAGLYVPGGQAAYPSSVLMNAIPARVAGVERLVICVPTPDGIINPLVLLAAQLSGVDEIYRVGGAQAVAAMAYGTGTIRPVDKITGPGNAFVAAAKKQVFGRVGIDMIAGPSEVLIIAEGAQNPDWLALDLLAQAEHDADAQSILITTDPGLAHAVAGAVDRLLPTLPRAGIAGASWRDYGTIIIARDLGEAAQAAVHGQAAACRLHIAGYGAQQGGLAAAIAADKANAFAAERQGQAVKERRAVRRGEGKGIEREKGRHGQAVRSWKGSAKHWALRNPCLWPPVVSLRIEVPTYAFRR